MSNYITKTTSELQMGDVVNCHGMRCLIDQDIHQRDHGNTGQPVYWTTALVLNRDEVPFSVVPESFTAEHLSESGSPRWERSGEHRWTIQGNDFARWAVEPQSDANRLAYAKAVQDAAINRVANR